MADLHTLNGYTTEPAAQSCCSHADRVFDLSAIVGAAVGAWAGVGVSASAFPGANPALLGTLGVVLGSALAAIFGRYVVLPVWAGLFSTSRSW